MCLWLYRVYTPASPSTLVDDSPPSKKNTHPVPEDPAQPVHKQKSTNEVCGGSLCQEPSKSFVARATRWLWQAHHQARNVITNPLLHSCRIPCFLFPPIHLQSIARRISLPQSGRAAFHEEQTTRRLRHARTALSNCPPGTADAYRSWQLPSIECCIVNRRTRSVTHTNGRLQIANRRRSTAGSGTKLPVVASARA